MYIGRRVEPGVWTPTSDHHLKRDRLTRHAVCLGMTGSGKTGLLITLLEEVALSGVPVIAVDPKGDLTNLALAPRTPDEFAAWAPEDADPAALSARWHAGLTEWGVDAATRQRWADVPVSVYTPGSTAGAAVDVLGSLGAPPAGLSAAARGDLVTGTVSGLLGLVGLEADPVTDPGHIVLSQLLDAAWTAGQVVTLESLLPRLVDPPFARVGVFPLDMFFPRKDRMALALRLNGVVASPAFAAWTEGTPLDPGALVEQGGVHVFTLAHLEESQRQFFVTLLLERLVAWSRRQPGSSDLRALLAIDEVMGYAPPHPRNPGSKRPLLTLMKQARAVGVGVVLATQNPVDLDYKAMSNSGLWFVGRLQTRQDRERVRDGLGDAAAGVNALPGRCFAVRDVRADGVVHLHSRWALSYLRGPLTLAELGGLGPEAPVADDVMPVICPIRDDNQGLSPTPPPAPTGYPFRYLDPGVVFASRLQPALGHLSHAPREDGHTVWEPALYAKVHLRFDEGRSFAVETDDVRLFFPLGKHASWEELRPDLHATDLLDRPPGDGRFTALPAAVDEAREVKGLRKRVVDGILDGEAVTMYRHRGLRLTSRAGESHEAFMARVDAAIEDAIAEGILKLRERFEKQAARLTERQRKLAGDLDRAQAEHGSRRTQELVNAGEMVMSMLLGRRRRLTSAMTKRRQTARAGERVDKLHDDLEAVQRQVDELQAELASEMGRVAARERATRDEVEETRVGLERGDIDLRDFGIVWLPLTRPV